MTADPTSRTTRPPRRRGVARRLAQLYVGLLLYALSMAMMVRANLGLDPWDVFHQGLSRRTGMSFGTATVAAGVLVMLLWIPLRQRPGLGTVSNVIVIGLAVDRFLALIPRTGLLAVRVPLLLGGVALCAFGGALYIGARFGAGPRDGLMTGWSARSGRSIRVVRTVIEVSVLAVGFVLGGTPGVGTVVFALAIGPLTQFFLPRLTAPTTPAPADATASPDPDPEPDPAAAPAPAHPPAPDRT